MQDNEFEKQVQQKMDGLRLPPSEAVWQKIEVRVKKEKRSRWILIFLPLLLILSLYGGYMLLSTIDSTHEYQQPSKKSIATNTITEKIKPALDSIKNNEPLIENVESNTEATDTKRNRRQKIRTTGKLKMSSDYPITESLEKDTSPILKHEADTIKNIVQNEKTELVIENHRQEKISANENKPDSIMDQNENSSQVITGIIKNEEEKNEIKTDTSTKKIKPANKYSWNWGFSFTGGVSSMANSFLEYGEQKADATAYTNSSPGPITGSNPLPGPSLIKPSIAFITGISAERNISKKIMFTTGLTYKLFSTTNTVGTDSANYFRSGSAASTYHNHYHYIGLPVGLKFQIVDLKKIQLYWNTGFSISQLVSSNALQFNNATRLYYHDNSLFNKTQVGFHTGLDIRLFSKQNQSLLIGPYLNYSISKIAREGYNKHHFMFIGLRAEYFFRKK